MTNPSRHPMEVARQMDRVRKCQAEAAAQAKLVDQANAKIKLLFARDVLLFPGATTGGAGLMAAAPQVCAERRAEGAGRKFHQIDFARGWDVQGCEVECPSDRLFNPEPIMNPRGGARPAGNAPKWSAYGLAAECMLTGLIPFLVIQSLVPFFAHGLDIWLNSLLPVIAASFVAAIIVFVGLYRRSAWYINFVYGYGWLIFVCFLVGVCAAIGFLFGVVPGATPDLRFITYVNIVEWLAVSPLAWLLLKMLRLHYWRPWSTPEQWEPPDDVRPGKTVLMALLERKP